jgi:hypothetical protein
MMDGTPVIHAWPQWPYRGLDYYREADAPLFGGRTSDIKNCASLLLGFGVKVLLLQGSSGSGKSSFIRAGLIPFLKQTTRTDHRHQSFFLSSQASVIRCTTDPLGEIGRALMLAFEQESPFTEGFDGLRVPMAQSTREEIREMVRRAIDGPRIQAHEALVDALALLASDLPGRLIVILDQAEEVLTRSDGTSRSSDDAANGLFRFLEDVYLRNVDVRIIVSLRTEFYGRFRDELAISDNRFGHKASRGGVEPYLLRPLRDPKALKEIVLAPTEPDKPYNFSMDERLAGRIVRDLLNQLPSSVTPALQVVCASLYMGLDRQKRRIVERDYDDLGRLQGIINKYLHDGIAAVEPESGREAEAWHFLLHSLVSRQGGGTVVSLAESAAELEERGAKRGIAGPVKPRLLKLSTGRVPLLRAEPPDNPQVFSLKHDVLAIILQRWLDEHDAAIRGREEERAVNERLRAHDKRIFWASSQASLPSSAPSDLSPTIGAGPPTRSRRSRLRSGTPTRNALHGGTIIRACCSCWPTLKACWTGSTFMDSCGRPGSCATARWRLCATRFPAFRALPAPTIWRWVSIPRPAGLPC